MALATFAPKISMVKVKVTFGSGGDCRYASINAREALDLSYDLRSAPMPTPQRALLPALLLLAACRVQFDYAPLDSYTKPGVSQAQKTADLRRCEEALQRAGGSVAKSAYLQRSRTADCLKKQGYSSRPRHL